MMLKNLKYTSGVITFEEGDEFKIRADGAWDINVGKNGDEGGANIVIDEAGDYVIKMTIDENNNATIVAVSQQMSYGVIGSFSPSGWSTDVDMVESETAGTFTAEVTFNAGEQFKIRGNHSWDSGVNLGDDGNGGVVNSGSSGNWTIAEAGTYVITLVVGTDGTYQVSWQAK